MCYVKNLWTFSRRNDYYSVPYIANILFFDINMVDFGNKKTAHVL